jgi:hypothetical protein
MRVSEVCGRVTRRAQGSSTSLGIGATTSENSNLQAIR